MIKLTPAHMTLIQYRSKVSWCWKLETQDSIFASWSSNASSFEIRGSSLKNVRSFENRELRSKVFRKNDVVQSRSCSNIPTVNQCLRCGVLFRLRQALNKCKSIVLVSKIYPACSVNVAFAHHVPRFSQMNWPFCELSLSRFYANPDEDYDIWVVKFAFLSSFNLFHVNVAFHLLS